MVDSPPIPKSLSSLFIFYHSFVKELYSEISSENCLPQETLFEIHAAFDHISRIWFYGEPEDVVVQKAYSHFKRSCLDVFKLKVKIAVVQWDEIRQTRIDLIDNGEFKRRAIETITRIKAGARKARAEEGISDNEDTTIKAFDLWLPVYEDCRDFENEFYNTEKVEWAKRVDRKIRWKDLGLGLLIGIIASLLANFLYTLFQ
jgi:hypothetical protein